ncbi:conjugative transfer signal peptidase TraF [Mesorhizobium sp. M2D.F.Ca.ET.185.01.1.1]|uniref:conjugative transfer signal peptidase TraF n=1 Tax=unclassified Mesorhizobium TaxID=325217 RepID=UPI000FCB38C4|nr:MULTISPECIES: conjugative transfer signal peptidase TraF [unclassified Mesorhizobium]TGP77307.1 conjugative transfer signal peptidase TraF [bacterium M00.F.Ca.ET.227.01.1.1]TGP93101.1 conjugative transfer signal peptidase TraF [bacterium M00.F.Ca.ET.222.01.1.1]TGP96647.1 conjugative transfer signal peptidase TraF [bacterium M00.F.Ca.ET.221.01.1.1]TGT95889.1 conjugative transfer signal peptidase TraF [bacterium M00.F.Ca.ET.163.01.1.1]TGU20722.1 conjugative transfer signal peptidase TraF [bac
MTRSRAIALISIPATLVLIGSAIALAGGYRLNLTPSEPLGLWRIETLDRDVAVGDLVFVCPPAAVPFLQARERGYLRRGLCAGGFAPLIKTVIALPAQHVEIGENVAVDGQPIPSSRVRTMDGEGRAVEPYSGGVVPAGFLFLHSPYASSYDSRYFGPIPASGLLGLARPVHTFDPR